MGSAHFRQNSPSGNTLAPQVAQKISGPIPSDLFFLKTISNNKLVRVSPS
jgi:hypothetical protein